MALPLVDPFANLAGGLQSFPPLPPYLVFPHYHPPFLPLPFYYVFREEKMGAMNRK
jgi:hypothetical protein